ncbi:MAG: hypothetical protein CMJ18_16155 [Phycisphaeraceae bacterium]|nr:hypothetical protein [Phycisphaeraceae bacterium]
MSDLPTWQKEPGARVWPSRPLDDWKVQGPGIVERAGGGFRLFYTAVGPDKPFPTCQGYILSAVSDDGLDFRVEPGIRQAPRPDLPHLARRALVPSIIACGDGGWRMYFEARGSAEIPAVVCSATSRDQVNWDYEGICLEGGHGYGGPRALTLPDGRVRLYACDRGTRGVASAVSDDGASFEIEPGERMAIATADFAPSSITAAQVFAPQQAGTPWTMYFSQWQDVPPGTEVPLHPVFDPDMEASENFAAASIASDMAGYRSRIYCATSNDGLEWLRGPCVIDGAGYGGEGMDAVHAEDMSIIRLADGRLRMYYATCDRDGNWGVASAVSAS